MFGFRGEGGEAGEVFRRGVRCGDEFYGEADAGESESSGFRFSVEVSLSTDGVCLKG
jgi:hypothetical protein